MARIKVLKGIVLGVFLVIAVRLFCIQILEHGDWVARANKEHTLLEEIVARRGEIYMMDEGEPVAVVLNQTTYTVIIDPSITPRAEIEPALSRHAPMSITANFDEIYQTEGLRYAIVAKNVSHAAATKLSEEGIGGVWFAKNNQRVYPEGELASGLLGFVNADGLGQYGIEGNFDKLLAGENGLLKTISDVNNVALSIGNENVKIPARDGENIVLTVDRGLEHGVEEIVQGFINDTAATNGSALVLNARTGEVLAMANLPNYDPADYGNVVDASAYINYVTEVPYEPASICKSFAFSAAINEGLMTPDTTYVNNGYEIIDGWTINNASRQASLLGPITMRTALSWSLNTGSIYALKLLGGNPSQITEEGRLKLYDYYYNKFRLGQPTGIEIAEAVGIIPDPVEGWGRDSTYANMTFGQNLNVTMIQTVAAFSAVVNGGTWRTPTIIRGVLSPEGEMSPFENGGLSSGEAQPSSFGEKPNNSAVENSENREDNTDFVRVEEQILSAETSATMRDLLIGNRKSRKAIGIDPDGYDIGGKTGTAQAIVDGRYDDTMSETIGGYAGFIAPAGELPEYIILVKMWGDGSHLDGAIAQEVFESLSNFAIKYLKIKPNL